MLDDQRSLSSPGMTCTRRNVPPLPTKVPDGEGSSFSAGRSRHDCQLSTDRCPSASAVSEGWHRRPMPSHSFGARDE
jgi:hypothetical protein